MKGKDIRKGKVLVYNNAPHQVVDFLHTAPGNKRAFVQTKMRNLMTGATTDTKFSSTEELEEADVFSFHASFLYKDGDGYHFMNGETYEQTMIPEAIVGDGRYYLQDGMSVEISTYNGDPIGIKLPKTTTLTVAETDPEMRGATATNSYKPAKTDTGLSLLVPPFVKQGERIVVDTEEGKYLSRAN